MLGNYTILKAQFRGLPGTGQLGRASCLMLKDKNYDGEKHNWAAKFAERGFSEKEIQRISDEIKLVGRNKLIETKPQETVEWIPSKYDAISAKIRPITVKSGYSGNQMGNCTKTFHGCSLLKY